MKRQTIVSNGPLKTVAQVRRLAAFLATRDRQEQRDAAAFAARSPEAVLARPETQVELLKLSGSHCVRCARKVNLYIGEGLSSVNSPKGEGLCDRCESNNFGRGWA